MCFVFVKAFFSSYESETVMTMDGNIYYLQYGSYISKDILNESVSHLSNYYISEEEGKYYVYVGMFTNYENALRYSELLENDNIYTFIKNDYLTDSSLINDIKKLDESFIKEENTSKLKKINDEILNLFKEKN